MFYVLFAVPAGLLLLLAIPVTLTFRLAWPEGADNDARLCWAFGLVRLRLPTETPAAAPDGRRAAEGGEDTATNAAGILAALRLRAFRRRLLRFAADLWRAFHKDEVSLDLRVGLDDPADTGLLWSILGPASALLSNVRDAALCLRPVFGEPTFELDASGRIRVVPLRLLYLAVALTLSPSIWRGFGRMRSAA